MSRNVIMNFANLFDVRCVPTHDVIITQSLQLHILCSKFMDDGTLARETVFLYENLLMVGDQFKTQIIQCYDYVFLKHPRTHWHSLSSTTRVFSIFYLASNQNNTHCVDKVPIKHRVSGKCRVIHVRNQGNILMNKNVSGFVLKHLSFLV